MKCTKCGQEMLAVKKDISKNFDDRNPKEYDRTIYHCEKDDIWVNIETPKKIRPES